MIVSIIGKRLHTVAKSTCLPAHASPSPFTWADWCQVFTLRVCLWCEVVVCHGIILFFWDRLQFHTAVIQCIQPSSFLPSIFHNLATLSLLWHKGNPAVCCCYFSVCLPLDTIFVHLIKHTSLAPRPSLYQCEYLGRLASLLGGCPFSVSSARFEMVFHLFQFHCSESKTSQTCGTPLKPAKQLG